MKNINQEFEDWVTSGDDGGRTKDLISVLRAYEIILTGVSPQNIILVTEQFEELYNKLK